MNEKNILNRFLTWCRKYNKPGQVVIRKQSEEEQSSIMSEGSAPLQPSSKTVPETHYPSDAGDSEAPGIRLLYDYRCLERPFYTKISDHFKKQTNANQTMPVFPNPAVKIQVLNQDSVKTTIREKCDIDPQTGEIMYPDYMLTVKPADAIANVERLIREILEQYTQTVEGTTMVKYTALRVDMFFEKNQIALTDLSKTKLDDLGEEKLKPFFINLHNLLVIHQVVIHIQRRLKSVLDIRKFNRGAAYRVGNCIYTLDDIKHGILRGNRPHPECTQRHFTYNDRRLVYSIRKRDPRIHFALVNGCKSSPKLIACTSEKIDDELNSSASEFCTQNLRIKSPGKICIHRLFEWYGILDFGKTNKAILKWILQYLPKDKTDAVRIISRKWSSSADMQVEYETFDWTLNNV